jgi:hypothetical protein
MIIDPMVEVRDVGFFRQLRRRNLGLPQPDPIRDALKAVAAHVPPVTMADRGIAITKYLARSGVPVSCEVRKFTGGPPPAPTIPLTDSTAVTPEVDPADVEFLYSAVVPADLRRSLIHAVSQRPRADQGSTFFVAWEEGNSNIADGIAELVDREPKAAALFRLFYGPGGSPAKRAAAAAAQQPRHETVATGLAKIVSASQGRRAAEGARQVQVIKEAMRRNGLMITRTPAVAMRKMFEVGDDGVERYPDKRSVKILIRSAIGEPDASIFLNWIDTLDRMPIRKAASERDGAAFQGLLKRIDRHPVTPVQAGLIRRALMGGY